MKINKKIIKLKIKLVYNEKKIAFHKYNKIIEN